MPVIQGVFPSSVKNSYHIAKTIRNLTTIACLFFWALIFHLSDFKLPTVAKNVKKKMDRLLTVLTLSHGSKCVIHI